MSQEHDVSETLLSSSSNRYFRGGTQAPMNPMAIMIIDLRPLELTKQQGEELHAKVNELVLKELESMGIDLSARSCHDLSKSVCGFAIE